MAKKILIIDDELDMRVYLGALFKKAGFEIETAENGVEGMGKARAFGPDLITLDIMMPKRSGMKAYQELRSTPETKNIPIIVLTGLSKTDDFFGGELGGLARPEAIVEKPIDRDAFLKKVGEVLEG